MSDNIKESEIQTKEEGKREKNKKNKNFLVYYSIALFIFAAVLIGLSYLSQARVAADTNKKLDVLTEKTEISVGVQNRLEQVSVKNDELEKENETLTKENEELKKQIEDLQTADKRAQANEYLWKIQKAQSSKKIRECKKYIDELDASGLRDFLTSSALSELVKIETAIE